jgi:hypothetical protein
MSNRNEVVMAYLYMLFQNLSECTQENQDKSHKIRTRDIPNSKPERRGLKLEVQWQARLSEDERCCHLMYMSLIS